MMSPLALALLVPLLQTGGISASAAARPSISLDGAWEVRHDAKDEGLKLGWSAGGPAGGWSGMQVPSLVHEWQALAGLDGVFWLRRRFTFESPSPGDSRIAWIRFEQVLGTFDAWLNGEKLESRVEGGRGVLLRAAAALHPGENVLVVRLDRPAVDGSSLVSRAEGIAAGVTLERMPVFRIDEVRVRHQMQGGADVVDFEPACRIHVPSDQGPRGLLQISSVPSTVRITEAGGPRYEATISRADGTLVDASAVPPGPSAGPDELNRARVVIRGGERWDLSRPITYRATVRLMIHEKVGDVVADEVEVVFGLRDFEIRGSRAYLNGRPLVIKAAVDAGYEPLSIARSTEAFPAATKVKLLKQSGFNALVVSTPPRALVDAANAHGLLLVEQPRLPSSGTDVAASRDRAVLRDRNDPSVVWWGFADGDDALIEGARALAPGAVVSRDAVRSGLSYFVNPGGAERVPYLRPDFHLDAPLDVDDLLRVRDLGDRDDFCFVTASAGAEIADVERIVGGVGDQRWRVEARAFEPWLADLAASFARDGLKAFFDAPRAMIEQSQVLHAVATGRLIEALRSNPRVGAYALRYFGDSPDAPAAGFGVDLYGRPKRGLAAAALANAPRRVIALPRVRAGALQDEVEVWLAPVADEGPPIDLKLVEVKRPDGLHGERTLLTDPDFKDHRIAPIAFMGGAGKYLVTPAWVGLTQPWVEEVILLGIDPGKKPFEDGAAPIARPAPRVAVVGAVGDLWTQEERFLAVADALEVARQGGTTILLDALERESPLAALDLVGAPNLGLRCCERALHAIAADPAFGDLASRGILGDPLNEVAPRDTLIGLPDGKGERVAVSIDERGDVVGTDCARLPLGKGTVVLMTLRVGQSLASDVVARRIATNLIASAVAAKGPALPTDLKASDRETLRARFREAAAKRAAQAR